MSRALAWCLPISKPAATIPFALGSASIASLLLYFYGTASMAAMTRWLLLPSFLALLAFALWAWRRGRSQLLDRVGAGLWAGALATLAYDVSRVPIVVAGVPVFKAISYFGTVILGVPAPTVLSEIVGWTYHLSNGVGFGLMYAMLVKRPTWWSAVAWGLFLEFMMLLTPYAEVFGYRVSPKFLGITIGAHVVYGLTLWAALLYWQRHRRPEATIRRPGLRLALIFALAPMGIAAVAADSYGRHASKIPPSPPPYLGSHLYTTWDNLEPDRVAVMWTLQRFVDPAARFHLIEPFSPVRHGVALDTPEAEIRRVGGLSATESLVAKEQLGGDARLTHLAKMTHLFEVTPWMRPSDPEASVLGQDLVRSVGECAPSELQKCLERGFAFLDDWYSE